MIEEYEIKAMQNELKQMLDNAEMVLKGPEGYFQRFGPWERLRASHIENFKWAKELTEILGPEHPRARKQWEETNKILKQKLSVKNGKEHNHSHRPGS